MDQVIHGVNKPIQFFSLSNYSLTTQIVVINLSTASLALIFLFIFNFFLITSEKNINKQNYKILEKLKEITNHLSQNAIKRIPNFDDNCAGIPRENKNNTNLTVEHPDYYINCDPKNFNNDYEVRIEDKPPQLEPTYTQKYIYSKFLNPSLNVKVVADSLIKFVDTNDVYNTEEEVVILDIDEKINKKIKENKGFYENYKQVYFLCFNFIKNFIDEKKLKKKNLKKIKNDNIIVIEIIKKRTSGSYIYKDEEDNFKIIFAGPILKDNKVYGVVLLDSKLVFEDYEGASQSILLTNFFLFFISIMFFLSFLFLKSIVVPIKMLSRNTNLERNKSSNIKNNINYPNRKDEIGKLSEDIKSMSNDLKKRIIEIEEFALDVSHELKNPLTGLKSSSELLKTNKLNEENRKLLIENMGADIDRMNILITDIANYTLTGVEISEEVFEKIELIEVLKNFMHSIFYNNFLLEIQNEEKEIYLTINKNKFLQVMHNLFDNALTYIPINSKILIFVKVEDKKCIIDFVDQGPGISLNYKDKIFQRFYTDRDVNKKSHSGLGLSISKKIIESFGGNIRLTKSTHLGFDGACFEIKLPL